MSISLNPEAQHAAHVAVSAAVKAGTLVPTSSCERCGRVPALSEERLHAHHHRGYDLAYVFDVRWLCRACHLVEHPEKAEAGGHAVLAGYTAAERSEIMRLRAVKAWRTRRARYGPTGLSDTPRVNARS